MHSPSISNRAIRYTFAALLLLLAAGCRTPLGVHDVQMKGEVELPKSSNYYAPSAVMQSEDPGVRELFEEPERVLDREGAAAEAVDTGDRPFPKYSGDGREKLMRYLAESAEWYLTIRHGETVAFRRYVEKGTWLTSELAFANRGSGHWLQAVRIVVLPDARAVAFPYQGHLVSVKSGSGLVPVQVPQSPDDALGPLYPSTTVIESDGPSLAVFEDSMNTARPFTSAAIAYVGRELWALADGRQSMPTGSVKRGSKPEMHRVYAHWGDSDMLCGYVNPKEAGYVYAAIFDAKTGKRIAYRRTRENALEYTGWSNDDRLYYYCLPIPGGIDLVERWCRIELRFVPESGAPERCLIVRDFFISQL